MINILDRSVQYPNRYQLTLVGGETDIYELTPITGTVAEIGSLVNRELMMSFYGFQDNDVEFLDELLNAVTNGDFSDGTTGWNASGGVLSILSNVLSVTGDGSAIYVAGKHNISGGTIIGHKWFVYCKARVTNSVCANLRIRLGSQSGQVIISPVQDTWYDLYNIFTTQITNEYVYPRSEYADAATANGKIMEIDGIAGVFAIKMTDTVLEDWTEAQMLTFVQLGYFESLSGPIVETNGDGDTKTTIFNADGSITEIFTDGTIAIRKDTVFNVDGSITETIS